MDEKIKKSLKFLGLGYMLFFCFAVIPYLGLMFGFKGANIAYIMLFPLICWWIIFFKFFFSKDLGNEAKRINEDEAMIESYRLSIIFCIINIVLQVLVMIFANNITPLPMILSVLNKKTFSIILAILALFSGSMVLAPLFMYQFTNADLGSYVKKTTTTYIDFGYSETKVSDKFIKSGQFVRMALLTSLLSVLVALTPAVIVVLIISIVKSKKYKKV